MVCRGRPRQGHRAVNRWRSRDPQARQRGAAVRLVCEEDDREAAIVRPENACKHLRLVHGMCAVHDLLDLLDRGRIVVVCLRANAWLGQRNGEPS